MKINSINVIFDSLEEAENFCDTYDIPRNEIRKIGMYGVFERYQILWTK